MLNISLGASQAFEIPKLRILFSSRAHFFIRLFFVFCFLFLFVCLFFGDRVSLCNPGCPGNHSVDQAALELRNLPALE